MNAKHWLSVAMLHVTLPHVSMQDAGPKGECQSSRMYQNGLQTPGSKGGVYFADYLKSRAGGVQSDTKQKEVI